MMSHTPLSPFHLSAASAINSLKSIVGEKRELLLSASKQEQSKRRKVDSDLKAAAFALTGLSGNENVLPNVGKTIQSPKAAAPSKAPAFHMGTHYPKAYHHHRHMPTNRPQYQTSHAPHRHGGTYPGRSSSHHHHHHQHYHHQHQHQHHQHRQSHPKMVPNPMAWYWPMVPAQASQTAWPTSYPAQQAPAEQSMATSQRVQTNEMADSEAWNQRKEEHLRKLEKEYVEKKKQALLEQIKADNINILGHNSSRRKRATWTQAEDNALSLIVKEYEGSEASKICWATIASRLPGRDSKQCRDRWLNHLDPEVKKHSSAPWTMEEDRKLINFIAKHGTRWRLMQFTILPDRTELTIKNRWNSAMKRRYTRFLSRRWAVPETKIKLLNDKGLLHPGVDTEELLKVAQSKMSEVAYTFGTPKCSREIICSPGMKKEKDMTSMPKPKDLLQAKPLSKSFLADMKGKQVPNEIHVRIIMGRLSDETYEEDLGVFEIATESCFALTRQHLMQLHIAGKLNSHEWMFTVPTLGILSQKQEIDLGPMYPILANVETATGTKEDPLPLRIVEQS